MNCDLPWLLDCLLHYKSTFLACLLIFYVIRSWKIVLFLAYLARNFVSFNTPLRKKGRSEIDFVTKKI